MRRFRITFDIEVMTEIVPTKVLSSIVNTAVECSTNLDTILKILTRKKNAQLISWIENWNRTGNRRDIAFEEKYVRRIGIFAASPATRHTNGADQRDSKNYECTLESIGHVVMLA